jgi:NitT/TauT family transport system permease protein
MVTLLWRKPTDRRFGDRILETAYRPRNPRVFAALVLISLTGIAIFVTPSLMTGLLPHWHDSAIARDL